MADPQTQNTDSIVVDNADQQDSALQKRDETPSSQQNPKKKNEENESTTPVGTTLTGVIADFLAKLLKLIAEAINGPDKKKLSELTRELATSSDAFRGNTRERGDEYTDRDFANAASQGLSRAFNLDQGTNYDGVRSDPVAAKDGFTTIRDIIAGEKEEFHGMSDKEKAELITAVSSSVKDDALEAYATAVTHVLSLPEDKKKSLGSEFDEKNPDPKAAVSTVMEVVTNSFSFLESDNDRDGKETIAAIDKATKDIDGGKPNDQGVRDSLGKGNFLARSAGVPVVVLGDSVAASDRAAKAPSREAMEAVRDVARAISYSNKEGGSQPSGGETPATTRSSSAGASR